MPQCQIGATNIDLFNNAMKNYVSGFGSWVTIIMGATFVTCVLGFRCGIVGEIEHRFLRK